MPSAREDPLIPPDLEHQGAGGVHPISSSRTQATTKREIVIFAAFARRPISFQSLGRQLTLNCWWRWRLIGVPPYRRAAPRPPATREPPLSIACQASPSRSKRYCSMRASTRRWCPRRHCRPVGRPGGCGPVGVAHCGLFVVIACGRVVVTSCGFVVVPRTCCTTKREMGMSRARARSPIRAHTLSEAMMERALRFGSFVSIIRTGAGGRDDIWRCSRKG